jgi:hypothetical protein
MIMKAKKEPYRALSVRLPESLYQRVKAAAHGRTVDESMHIAEYIREALERSLERNVPPPDSSRNVQATRPGSWLSGTAGK